MYKDNGHSQDDVLLWSKEDKEEIETMRKEIEYYKKKINKWTLAGDMEMVASLAELISMYQEYVDMLIDKYKENYGTHKNKPNIDFFRRNQRRTFK